MLFECNRLLRVIFIMLMVLGLIENFVYVVRKISPYESWNMFVFQTFKHNAVLLGGASKNILC